MNGPSKTEGNPSQEREKALHLSYPDCGQVSVTPLEQPMLINKSWRLGTAANTSLLTPPYTLQTPLCMSSSCCCFPIPNLPSGSHIETYHFNHVLSSQEANLHYKSQIPFPGGSHVKALASFSLFPRVEVLDRLERMSLQASDTLQSAPVSHPPYFLPCILQDDGGKGAKFPPRVLHILNHRSISDDARAID